MTDLDRAKVAFLEKVDDYRHFEKREQAEALLIAAKAVEDLNDPVPGNNLYDVSKAAEHETWAQVSYGYAAKKIILAIRKRFE